MIYNIYISFRKNKGPKMDSLSLSLFTFHFHFHFHFNQLFGEADPDEDVSPDTEDPEAAGDEAGEAAAGKEGKEDGSVERKNTRAWAEENNYNTQKLFKKLFTDDIKYLLSMDKLWEKRKAPKML